MLRSEKQLEGLTIGATDGTIGKVKDFYFDDEAWSFATWSLTRASGSAVGMS